MRCDCSAAVPAAVRRASPPAAPRARRPRDSRQDASATIYQPAVRISRSRYWSSTRFVPITNRGSPNRKEQGFGIAESAGDATISRSCRGASPTTLQAADRYPCLFSQRGSAEGVHRGYQRVGDLRHPETRGFRRRGGSVGVRASVWSGRHSRPGAAPDCFSLWLPIRRARPARYHQGHLFASGRAASLTIKAGAALRRGTNSANHSTAVREVRSAITLSLGYYARSHSRVPRTRAPSAARIIRTSA